jgi:hypothetical protein
MTRAASTAPMMAARRGSYINRDRKLRQRAWYYSQPRRRPQGHEHRLRAERRLLPLDRRRQDLPAEHQRAARRQPRPVDRAERSAPHGAGERRRRQRLDQRRRDLDRPGLRDGAVLPRGLHQRTIPYKICGAQQDNSTLCGPSRQQGRVERSATGRTPAVASRATSRPHPPSRTSSLPAATRVTSRARTCAPASRATSPCIPQPDGVVVGGHQGEASSGPSRSSSRAQSQGAVRRRLALFRSTNEGESWCRCRRSSRATTRARWRLGRPDHQGPDRRRDLRRWSSPSTSRPSGGGALGGHRRRLRAGRRTMASSWENVTPQGHRRLHAHLDHRAVALRERHGVRRGQSVPARRQVADPLQDRRLRQDLDEDRERDRRRITSRA